MSFQFCSRIQTLTFPSLPFLPFKPNFIQLPSPHTHFFLVWNLRILFSANIMVLRHSVLIHLSSPLLKPTQTNSKCWIIVLSSPCANPGITNNLYKCRIHVRIFLPCSSQIVVEINMINDYWSSTSSSRSSTSSTAITACLSSRRL